MMLKYLLAPYGYPVFVEGEAVYTLRYYMNVYNDDVRDACAARGYAVRYIARELFMDINEKYEGGDRLSDSDAGAVRSSWFLGEA